MDSGSLNEQENDNQDVEREEKCFLEFLNVRDADLELLFLGLG